MITIGDTQGVIELIKNLKIKEIVGIRGLSLEINDIEDDDGVTDTIMWNPLHFAVYYQNYDLIKFFLKDMKINVSMTAPKANADSEKDAVNTEKYTEDKILIL